VLAAVIFVKCHDLDAAQTADVTAPSIALGQTFGRLGCFSAGCCYGAASDLPWAVTFRHPETLAPPGVPLHPTQLYSAAANLLIFLFLWGLRKRKRFAGQLFSFYLLLYGLSRFVVEGFRGDFRGSTVLDLLSISQVLGLCSAVVGLLGLILLPRLAGTSEGRDPERSTGGKRGNR
jgi:phosphatidylglycerol:prolipoprotein diacylglycerol transferase